MHHIFTVTGMTCGHCEKAITNVLQSIDAQAVIQIDRTQSKVEVESQALRQTLINAIAEEGYGVT